MANQHSTPERNRVAREGAEWIDKMATVQSLASQREPFENMAAAVRSLANDYESLVEQLQTYEKALRWIERCAYDHHQQHTMFTHIQRRAMAVLNPATEPKP